VVFFCNERKTFSINENVCFDLYFSDSWFNGDVILRKENLTPLGMNIRFSLLVKSTTDVFCADWHSCSLDSN
jgi:hypothetical protein